jgi:hypothetical protein
MIRDDCKQFLLEQAHAADIKHSGRTLYAHLCGTHDLLEAWGNDEPVCTAGLFHSIYGTRKFKKQAWPLTDRATIQRLIGYKSEALAYLFCTADRPEAFFESMLGPLGAAHNDLLRQMREIEAANLIEQGSKSRSLARLHDSDISNGAKHAIKQSLGMSHAT